jgi:2-(1,2-epoxy-1,2-dihydrophenyl)acetyl-CoA isomerase
VRLTKRAAYRSFDADVETALELAATFQGMSQNTADHREAVAAILEKRAPTFRGE